MKREYVVRKTNVPELIDQCFSKLKSMNSDAVFIMSISINDFGHVWVIEKRFILGKPRYHHYQSTLNSHLFIDFIEHKDYGRNLQQSLDIDEFASDLTQISLLRGDWTDDNYRLYAKLFAYRPKNDVNMTSSGFAYTWIKY